MGRFATQSQAHPKVRMRVPKKKVKKRPISKPEIEKFGLAGKGGNKV